MTLIGANALKDLKQLDIRVLTTIEIGMINSEFVAIEDIARKAKLTLAKVETILNKCHKLDLVHRWTGHYVGYELTIHGYDALALNTLYEKGLIASIGKEKGVGKEARVYYALTKDDQEVILKLHRVGFTSFHRVKKKRRYTANKKHISALYSSRISAQTEVKWMKIANEHNLIVPKYIDSNRHIIVQELIIGYDLNKVRVSNPQEILEAVLDFIDIAWKKAKFVHGDLSEHNIIINMDEKAIIIDFPQSVENSAENAEELLIRDIKNILIHFNRKYGLVLEEETVLNQILTN